ncbi:MAG: cupin domain-containing protein [Acidobacteria bacterium]|nr:cupin domain-containing protein [Acidobacteriota bacterium]MCK6681596.1 cupin domain-containing protein [Thermoanaerobaculia bacterium]
MANAETKNFVSPDEVREFPNGKVELVNIGGGMVGRLTVRPGWKWSTDVKPIAGTGLCEAPHFQYILKGCVHVVMADGEEFDVKAGDVSLLGAGHDAWVVGDEECVAIDWHGATHYAEKK